MGHLAQVARSAVIPIHPRVSINLRWVWASAWREQLWCIQRQFLCSICHQHCHKNTRCSCSAATLFLQVTLIPCHIWLLTKPKPTKAFLCLILTEVKGRRVSRYCWLLLIRQALPPPGGQGQHKMAFRVVGKVWCCQLIIFKRSIKGFRVFSHPHWLKLWVSPTLYSLWMCLGLPLPKDSVASYSLDKKLWCLSFSHTAMTMVGKGLARLNTTGEKYLRSDSTLPPVLYQQNLDVFSIIILVLWHCKTPKH